MGDWWKREKEGGRKKGERDKRGAGGGGGIYRRHQGETKKEAKLLRGREERAKERSKKKGKSKEREGNLGHQRNEEKTSSSFFRSATATIFGAFKTFSRIAHPRCSHDR